MALVRTLMILLGAFAVLTLGATPMASASEPPCHSRSHEAPADQRPSKALKVMNCCVACVVAPRIEPVATPQAALPAASVFARSLSSLSGLTPSPAHGPPRA